MNKLLSFNPEPFETELELEATFQEYEAEDNGPEREGDWKV